MAISKIGICNLALASIGADSIRSFSETNKRARLCEVFFDYTRDYLLERFDWTFARKLVTLQLLATQPEDGTYHYALPNDCLSARDLAPKGSKDSWSVIGTTFSCEVASGAKLWYTSQVTDPAIFSYSFSNLLALGLATRLCLPVTQDKTMAKALYEQFKSETVDILESDANIGNDYPMFDNNPDNDTFVYPDGVVDDALLS